MKVLVLLSLVALCASQSTYLGNHVTVGRDGNIAIVGEYGREIYIYKNVMYPTKVDMILKSPYGPTRKIEIDQTNNIHNVDVSNWDSRYYSTWRYINDLGNDYTQQDILVYLFEHCQGLVSLEQYHNLMEKINYLVQKQVLHKTIWDVLKYFDNYYYQQGVYDFDSYVPLQEEQAVGQYGYNTVETVTPLKRLLLALRQQKLNQKYDEEVYPEYQNTYEQSYDNYQVSPLMKALYYLKNQQGQLTYPYYKQYQTPLDYQQVYPQGYYYQREYPQGYYQQEYPQGYYQREYPQGYYQREYSQGYYQQKYPQGYYQNQQYPQQWWNRQQYSLY